jgi:hypothetical protein
MKETVMSSEARAVPVVSWAEFFAAFDAAHRNPLNRWTHHVMHLGFLAGVLLLFGGHAGWGTLLVAAALPANWAAHRVFEDNRPAFLGAHDAWGMAQLLLGGFVWTAVTLPGDVARLVASH